MASVQAVLVQYFCSFVGTVPLSLHQYLLCIAFGFVGMPIAAVVKFVPVPKTSLSPVLGGMTEADFEENNDLEEPLLNNDRPAPTE